MFGHGGAILRIGSDSATSYVEGRPHVESREEPALRQYRRILIVFVALMSLVALAVGGVLASKGRYFEAVLALLVVGYLLILIRGYRQDAKERE